MNAESKKWKKSQKCFYLGIKKPNHRKKLKAAAEDLDIGDGLPDHVPRGLQEFMVLLRLQEYTQSLSNQVNVMLIGPTLFCGEYVNNLYDLE